MLKAVEQDGEKRRVRSHGGQTSDEHEGKTPTREASVEETISRAAEGSTSNDRCQQAQVTDHSGCRTSNENSPRSEQPGSSTGTVTGTGNHGRQGWIVFRRKGGQSQAGEE